MADENYLFEGLKVLDVGTWIAGPVAATILADFGADVIKVEMPGTGDAYRHLAAAPATPDGPTNYCWNMDARNKRSLTLNLKSAEGRAILARLVAECDVYVTNQPMSMRREFGLTWEDLAPHNPSMIYASLTAYGESGPERDREGFDLVAYWSRSGLMDLVRAPGAVPSDSVAGMAITPTAVAVYAGIVTALLKRERTGQGSYVSTSLLANGIWANGCFGQAALSGASVADWRSARLEAGAPTRYAYRTADDRFLQFTMVRTEEEYANGTRTVLGDPPPAGLESLAAIREDIAHAIHTLESAIAADTLRNWLDRFATAGVPASHVAELTEIGRDEQALANGVLVRPSDDGMPDELIINHPLSISGVPAVGPRRAPDIGEHNGEILGALGYTAAEIAALGDRQVI